MHRLAFSSAFVGPFGAGGTRVPEMVGRNGVTAPGSGLDREDHVEAGKVVAEGVVADGRRDFGASTRLDSRRPRMFYWRSLSIRDPVPITDHVNSPMMTVG